LKFSRVTIHNSGMENPDWRSKPFPDDLHVLMDDLLPDEADTEFGSDWAGWRKDCCLLIGVLAADLASRGPNCPLPPTYGGLCRLLRNTKNLTDWLTAVGKRAGTPALETIAQTARNIIAVPRKQRDLLFIMMAGFARDYEQRQTQTNR
jgi:hypothetical protein